MLSIQTPVSTEVYTYFTEGDKLRLQIDIKKLEKELESYKQRQQESGLT